MPGPRLELGWGRPQGILSCAGRPARSLRQSRERRRKPQAFAAKRTDTDTETDTVIGRAEGGAKARSRVPESLPSYVGADRQRDAREASGGGMTRRRVRPNKRLSGGLGAEPPNAAQSAVSLGKNTSRVSPALRGVPRSSTRERVYNLRDSLRAYARERCAKCGRVRVQLEVQIVRLNNHAAIRGVLRCGSVWECPVCSWAIRSRRAIEVQQAVDWYGPDRVYMLTLTVRHGLGHDLATIRRGVSKAWRLMQGGAPWKRFKESVGLFGSVRALEVTVGPNGFHPHLHVLFFSNHLDLNALARAREVLSARWRRVVARTLQPENVPDALIGCDLRACGRADYISKLGLEIVGAPSKSGRVMNLTPLEVAERFLELGDASDLATWKAFCAEMKGARMLTWSRGLREAAGLGEDKSDELLAEEMEELPAEIIYAIPGTVWDRVRDIRGASIRLVEAGDSGGEGAVAECLAALREEARESARQGIRRYG